MAPDPSFGRSTAGSLRDSRDQFELDLFPFQHFSLDILAKLPGASDFSVFRDEQVTANTRFKWKETREAQFFTSDSFGLKKEEVKIELVGDGSSRISGERHKKDAQKTAHFYRVERSSGEFVRQLRLEKEEVKIRLVDGDLRIRGEKHKRDFQQEGQWHRLNRSSEYRVPKDVNAGGISAKLEKGGLTVKDPKIKTGPASGSDVKSIDIHRLRRLKKKVASGAAVKQDIQETIPADGKYKCRVKVPKSPNIKLDVASGSDVKIIVISASNK